MQPHGLAGAPSLTTMAEQLQPLARRKSTCDSGEKMQLRFAVTRALASVPFEVRDPCTVSVSQTKREPAGLQSTFCCKIRSPCWLPTNGPDSSKFRVYFSPEETDTRPTSTAVKVKEETMIVLVVESSCVTISPTRQERETKSNEEDRPIVGILVYRRLVTNLRKQGSSQSSIVQDDCGSEMRRLLFDLERYLPIYHYH